MANAKVTLNGVTLIDLTGDTVSSDNLLSGYTAHRSDGEVITGSYVPAGVSLTPGSADPTESSQHITPSAGYDGFSYFDVGAISSDYIGSNIPMRSASDLNASDSIVSAPSGYYAAEVSKAIPAGSAITPTTNITATPNLSIDSFTGIISSTVNVSQNITPAITTGYISNGQSGTVFISGNSSFGLPTQAGATITPTNSEQVAVASGKYTLEDIKVAPIPNNYKDTTNTDAVASQVLEGKKFVNSTGLVVGTMPNIGAVDQTLQAASTFYTIPSGYHNGNGKVQINVETRQATPATTSQVIVATYGYVLSKVIVAAIPSQYIVTTDATATASDILYNKTAYVNGNKITGTFQLAQVSNTTLILNNTNSSVSGTVLTI